MEEYSKGLFKKNMIVIFCVILLFSPFGTAFNNINQVNAKSVSDAIEIIDVDGLSDIRDNLSGNYRLGADIDVSIADDWTPIGTADKPFEGIFNWNGFKLVELEKAEVDNYENFFRVVSNQASLVDIVVEDGSLTENAGDADDGKEGEIVKDIEVDKGYEDSDKDISDELEEKEMISSFAPMIMQTMGEEEVEFAGGNGSVNNPYLIGDAEQLNKVRENLDKHYKG